MKKLIKIPMKTLIKTLIKTPMKKLYTIIAVILLTASSFAQAPDKMSYQAVIRDASGSLISNQSVGIQLSIMQTTAGGTAVYVETQTPTTNANGLLSLEIGTGTVVTGNFSTIDWSADSYFIKTETDPAGGSSYSITGTSQLLSVPYALYAKTSGAVAGGGGGGGGALTLGQEYQGGIIIHLDASGEHGLIISKVTPPATPCDGQGCGHFAGVSNLFAGAIHSGLYEGALNTRVMYRKQGGMDPTAMTYATSAASNFSVTEGGVTYDDWYVPSAFELALIMENQSVIPSAYSINGTWYWSSTEATAANNYALHRDPDYGVTGPLPLGKNSRRLVRLLRAF